MFVLIGSNIIFIEGLDSFLFPFHVEVFTTYFDMDSNYLCFSIWKSFWNNYGIIHKKDLMESQKQVNIDSIWHSFFIFFYFYYMIMKSFPFYIFVSMTFSFSSSSLCWRKLKEIFDSKNQIESILCYIKKMWKPIQIQFAVSFHTNLACSVEYFTCCHTN